MLYMNNPEALVAIAAARRTEFGQRSTSDPEGMPAGATAQESGRPHSIGHRFHRITSTGYATS